MCVIPEDIVQQTLNNTTHFYPSVEADNEQDPRGHHRYMLPGLRYPRKREIVASDTFFPTVKSSCVNTCSQLFMGTVSDRWSVYPLDKEIKNGNDL